MKRQMQMGIVTWGIPWLLAAAGCSGRDRDNVAPHSTTGDTDDSGRDTEQRIPEVGAATQVTLSAARPRNVRVHPADDDAVLTFVDASNVFTYTTAWLEEGTEIRIDLAALESDVGRNLFADAYSAAALGDGTVVWLLAPDDGVDAHLGVAVVSPAGAEDLAPLPSDALPSTGSGAGDSEVVLTHHVEGGGSTVRLRHGADAAAFGIPAGDLLLAGGGVSAVAGDRVLVVGAALSSSPCTFTRELPVTSATYDGGEASTSCVDLGDEVVSLAAQSAMGHAHGTGAIVWVSDGASPRQVFVAVDGGALMFDPVDLEVTGTLVSPSERAVARAGDGWGVTTWNAEGECGFTWVPDDGEPASFALDDVTVDEAPSIATTADGFVIIAVDSGVVTRLDVALTSR